MGKVAIWMGHSGAEAGAQGILLEDNVTRQARTWAVAYARACGHTITTDNDNMSLTQRINASNSSHDGIVEWHANLLGTGAAHGTEVWYSQYDSGRGEKIANAMAAVGPKYGFTNRGAKDSSTNRYGRLGILDTPSPTSVLVELFFLDNAEDVAGWNKNGKAFVEGMTAAFLAGLGLKSTPDGKVPETPSVPSQPEKPSTPSGIGSGMVNSKTYQVTDSDVNVRQSQTTQSATIKTIPKGKTFSSARYANGENVDGKGYKWFEYETGGWIYGANITQVKQPQIPQITVDGQWGVATTKRLQQVYGTYVDGAISNQWKSSANQYIYSAQFNSTMTGSSLIKAIQSALGLKADGLCGADTIRAMQRKLGTYVDGVISPTGAMVEAMQRKLNQGQKPF